DHIHKSAVDVFTDQFKAKHPLTSPHRENLRFDENRRLKLKRPPLFCPVDKDGEPIDHWDDWIPGSVVLSLIGPPHFYRIISLGASIVVDESVHDKAIRDACPHLMRQDKYDAFTAAQSEAVTPAEKRKTKTEANSLRSE